ncbi:50S ribosomal protein L24 [Patescibacteria group bacterium]|nr:MAG: 50S ribosomal protein L24 [Patescibacteria group bacterium]
MKIKKGDTVYIHSGKDKGKKGKVLKALPRTLKVIVEGVNVKKVHRRPTRAGQKGQVIDKTAPIAAAAVMILDPKTGKPTRIGYREVGGKKVRVAKKSGNVIG